VCDDYTDSQQAAKARNDAITQVTNSEDHRRDLAAMGKVVFDQLHTKSRLRRGLDGKQSHEEIDRIVGSRAPL
jgi:hypothetical protein